MYILVQVANMYNQPENDLICIFKSKPSIQEIADMIGKDFPNKDDDITLKLVNIWSGEEFVSIQDMSYSLKEIQFGERL